MLNESSADRGRQSAFADLLTEHFNAAVQEMPLAHPFDYLIHVEGRTFVGEYKYRKRLPDEYPTVYFEVAKAVSLETHARHVHADPVLFVQWSDGSAHWLRVNVLDLVRDPSVGMSWVQTRKGEQGRSGADEDLLFTIPLTKLKVLTLKE